MFYEFPVWNSKSSSTHDDETELRIQSVRRSVHGHFSVTESFTDDRELLALSWEYAGVK